MDYTLHQLEIYKKVAELKSVTRASEALFLTQPAISIQLKKFQEQFPQPLFEVISRQLYLTDFGIEVANYVERILDEIDELNTRTLTFDGQLAGKLKLALVSTAKYVMPYFLTDFIKSNGNVTLSMDVTNKATVIQSLEKNLVDFALVSVIPENLKINKIALMKNRLFLVGGRQYEQQKSVVSKKAISELPMLYRENGSATRQIMENYMNENGIPNIKRLELTSNEAVKQAIIAGLGYSIVPLIGIKNELEYGDIQIINAKGLPITTNWNLIWLQSKKLSPTAQAFIDFIHEKKQHIIEQSFDWFEKY